MPIPLCLFKVALKDTPKIWRRVAVRRSQTLDHLHAIIFKAFDRHDPHLYSFYFPTPGSKAKRVSLRDGVEYTSPHTLEDGESWGDDPTPGDAAKTKLSSLELLPGQKFFYLFDFGDDWWHEITVEATDSEPQPGSYPRILEKRGESPPQYPDIDEEQ